VVFTHCQFPALRVLTSRSKNPCHQLRAFLAARTYRLEIWRIKATTAQPKTRRFRRSAQLDTSVSPSEAQAFRALLVITVLLSADTTFPAAANVGAACFVATALWYPSTAMLERFVQQVALIQESVRGVIIAPQTLRLSSHVRLVHIAYMGKRFQRFASQEPFAHPNQFCQLCARSARMLTRT